MNELSKFAKTANIQNTREKRETVTKDEVKFDDKCTDLHGEANNNKEKYLFIFVVLFTTFFRTL